ncbi:carbohydrate-binding domain-containing protein [Radiobacillus sp. PE A8.2]|uniref:carbohydrate-binding domain-containing protein n=1 Tax=Radiobacillus sp. PE A8.2 TaxID=3380349 RepID=UPI00388D608A
MNKLYVKRSLSIFLIIVLITSLLPASVGAVESDYDNLIINAAKKPSEAGALKIIDDPYNAGQKTLGDKNGDPIQLRGMSTHGLQWFPQIINDNAFAALANDWGSNVVRLAMYVGEDGYAIDSSVKQEVIDGIDHAIANDMYVIVDWHVHAPGNPNEAIYSGALEFFDEISDLYPNNENIIYEVANEPSSNNNGGEGVTNDAAGWLEIKNYAEPIIAMLRDKGNENLVIVGSPNWSQRPDLAADNPVVDPANNTIYTLHFYSGSHVPAADSTDRENVMSNGRYALENGVAIFVSEWGTSEASGNNGPFLDEADAWLNFLNENNISWVNWSLTNKNETSAAFTPFELGKSTATDLNPGDDQVWAPEELSISGEYVRARIKGISYQPIDRTAFSTTLWDFNDGTTQGFGLNADSPTDSVSVSNENNAIRIDGLDASNDTSEGNYWANARLSADNWNESVNILGAEELTMDVIVDNPTTVTIAAIPQGPATSWANPNRAITVTTDDFVDQGDGTYKAALTIAAADAPSLGTIATSADNNEMNNIILFVGTDSADAIYLDNISVSGHAVEIPVIHDPKGEAVLPSDFEDGTRQAWDWSADSGVKEALKLADANDSTALSWEYAYPEVKPTDNWASAPRLDFYMDNLVIGDNDHVAFDLYVDPIRATEGAISINLVFQPPSVGYWAQASDTFEIDLTALDAQTKTPDGLYHYQAKIDVSNIENVEADTVLRNMQLIFADVESDFAGTMFIDNVRFAKVTEPTDPGDGDEDGSDPGDGDEGSDPGDGDGDEGSNPGDGDNSGETPSEPVVTTKPTITDGVAKINLSAIETVADGGVLVVDVTNQKQVKLELTSAQIALLKTKGASISVETAETTVSIPSSILPDGDVTIDVHEVANVEGSESALSGVYDITITSNDGALQTLGDGKITLKFRVDSAKVTNADQVMLYYYNESTNAWELVGGAYENGILTADVNHLSTFAAFETAPTTDDESADEDGSEEDKEGNELPDTATGTFNWMLAGLLLIFSGAAAIFYHSRRKIHS